MALTKIPANLLDKSAHVDFADNEKLRIGTDNDLQIYYDGTNNLIQGSAGNVLYIQAKAGENSILAVPDGAVNLYHNNLLKLETSATGATVTGTLTVTGDLDITGNVNSASVTDLDVTDKTITLGVGQTEAQSGSSGIIIDGSAASLLWDETNSKFVFNKNLKAGSIELAAETTGYALDATLSHYSSSNGVYLNGAGTNGWLRLNASGVSNNRTSIDLYGQNQGDYIKMRAGNADALWINSAGNVGIGASSPGTTLQVGDGTGDEYITIDKSTTGTGGLLFKNAGNNKGKILLDSNENLQFYVNNTTNAMTILESGNVGISYTTPYSRLWVEDEGINLDDFSFEDASSIAHLTIAGSNAHVRMHLGTMDVSPYGVYIQGGFDNSPDNSGTGNAGTEPLLLNPLGNKVGIGTKNPAGILDVSVANAKTANAGDFAYIGKTNEATGYQALQVFQIGGNAADERRYEFQTIEQGTSNDGIICFQKSGGRLFVGTDSADGNNDKLVVAGGVGISMDHYIGAGSGWGGVNGAGSSSTIQLYSSSTGNMTFNTNYSQGETVFNMQSNTKLAIAKWAGGTEAIRIYTPSGGMRLGALNSSYHHTMRVSGPSTYYWDNRCEASGGFHTYSDEKLKKEITTITGALDKVAVMNGVTFKWKDAENRGSGDEGKQFGVIAQNMLEVDSELPSLNVDPLAEPGNEETDEKYYSMDYSRITPFLIEAIKELKTKLEAAEARITELEG